MGCSPVTSLPAGVLLFGRPPSVDAPPPTISVRPVHNTSKLLLFNPNKNVFAGRTDVVLFLPNSKFHPGILLIQTLEYVFFGDLSVIVIHARFFQHVH